MHREPPNYLPYADRWDLLTIRTQDHAFHILPTTDSSIARHAINVLQSFEGYVYARSPQGLHRILQEEYAWAPEFYDITPALEEFINKDTLAPRHRQSSFSDIANILFKCSPCWKGRIFSCHARPSRCALRHREYFVSQVYVFALCFIGAHKQPGPAVGAAAVEEERRREEEERLLREEDDRRQREEGERIRIEEAVRQEVEEEERRIQEVEEQIRARRRENQRKSLQCNTRSSRRSRSRSRDRRRSSGAAESADDSSRRRRH